MNTLAFTLLLGFIAIVVFSVYYAEKNNKENTKRYLESIREVSRKHRVGAGDLEIFLNITNFKLSDFEKSKAIRIRFEKWVKGEINILERNMYESKGNRSSC